MKAIFRNLLVVLIFLMGGGSIILCPADSKGKGDRR